MSHDLDASLSLLMSQLVKGSLGFLSRQFVESAQL